MSGPEKEDVTDPVICVTAPSRACVAGQTGEVDNDTINRAFHALKALGWRVQETDNVRRVFKGFAGSDQERAQALQSALLDPENDLVMGLRGGTGAARILQYLDWDALKQSHAPFMGLSDLTAVNLALLAKTGLPSWQGPVAKAFANRDDTCTASFMRAVSSRFFELKEKAVGDEFSTEGILWGGNLTVLTSLLGTPWFPEIEGGIFFIEDVNEPAWRIDRMLVQLDQCGVLARQKAVIVGQMTGSDRGTGVGPAAYVLDDALNDLRIRSQLPVVSGLRFGHVADTLTMPVGVTARVSFAAGHLTIDCDQAPAAAQYPGQQTSHAPLWWV